MFFECKCYDLVREMRMRTWDGLEEKKIKIQVKDVVENETMRYLGEVWTKE